MNDKSKSFAIERGRTNETRFSSVESLDECVRAALVCLLDIDPVWPAWIKDYFTQTLVPDHPLLTGLEIPPRHQGYIAMVLGAAYDKARKDAKRLEALIAKKAEAVAAKGAESDIYPDGTIFAVLKTGVQADQANLKTKDIRRLSMLMTDTATKSKTRRRVLEPLSEGFSSKPFTAKHRVNFTPLRHVDAVRLLSDYAMGWDGREQIEMAFRLSLSLFDDALNPLLSAEGTVEIVHWAGDDVKIRVTKVRSTQRQILLAFRILRPFDEGSFLDASTGIAFLTLANKELTVALPSTFEADERRSQGERDILLNFIATTQGTNAEDLKRKLRVAFAENYLSPV